MKAQIRWLAALGAALLAGGAMGAELPGTGADEGKIVIYRDTWGVPHIYAPTAEEGLFAMGYAQAEDRPEELLKNLARGMGESTRFDGEKGVMQDMVAHLWELYEGSKRSADRVQPELRAHVQAFVAGINAYYKAHPEEVPAWWPHAEVDEFMVAAFGRMFLQSWSFDDGFGDLGRGGIAPGFEETERGSNQWAVAPSRSATGDAILYIDPHLSWYGASRFWECRVHAGDWHASGFGLAGNPYIGLGHNDKLAWAMTTGGPDTADVYRMKINPENPLQYAYEGGWRDFKVRKVTLHIGTEGATKELTLMDSHHGPVVAVRDGHAYAVKTAYADAVNGNAAWYHLNFAKDYTGAVAAMATQEVFPQNVMCADTKGNIYFQRTGRVPVRPQGYDWSRPLDGGVAATGWLGLHPSSDLVQLLNPESGYMQNCNIPPDAMIVKSPLTPDRWASYIYQDIGYGARGGWIKQRGARALELLSQDDSVTIEEALAYAVDTKVYGAERWIEQLKAAHEKHGKAYAADVKYTRGMADVMAWDLRADKDSTGALKYFYYRKQLSKDLRPEKMNALKEQIDDWFAIVEDREPREPRILPEEHEQMARSFSEAMAALAADYGSLDAKYGDRFRVGREGSSESWPVSGGGDENLGMRTLRSMSYSGENEQKQQWGRGGQTSTQIVVLSEPIQSWTQPPLGQSDRPDSPHYDDQAEQLFSEGKLKPSWWLPEELKDHIVSRTEIAPTL